MAQLGEVPMTDQPTPQTLLCPDCGHHIHRPQSCQWVEHFVPCPCPMTDQPTPRTHRPEWIDDVPTGFCECGLTYPHPTDQPTPQTGPPAYLGNPHDSPIWEELSDALYAAMTKHAPMNSPHEGWSVIFEELEELREHVRGDNELSARLWLIERQAAAQARTGALEQLVYSPDRGRHAARDPREHRAPLAAPRRPARPEGRRDLDHPGRRLREWVESRDGRGG
jgi:hypothetical protein